MMKLFMSNIERDGHSFLVSRGNTGDFIVRRLESESGDLLACVGRMIDLPARTGDGLEKRFLGVETWLETSGYEQSGSIIN